MSIRIWTFDEFVSADIPEEPYLVDPIIPRFGITLMHGPAGAGKSALGFHLVDAIQHGTKFLGLQTVRANALYLNLEMPQPGLQHRLKNAGFNPKAYLVNHPPLDMLQQGFVLTPIYRELRSTVKDLDVACVVVDNCGTLTIQSTGNDEVARRCIAILREWFDDRCVVMIHHNRKMRYDPNAGMWVVSDEDASGSKYWINSAVSVLHIKRENGEVRALKHTKSQVMKQLDEEVKFELADDGVHIELYDRGHKMAEAEEMLRKQHPDWDEMTETEKVKLIAKLLGKSTATIYRWRQEAR